jgi:hypothetical protein
LAVFFAELVHGHDIGVVERGQRPSLLFESGSTGWIAVEFGWQEF